MNKVLFLFLTMLISASIFAQDGEKLSEGELYAGSGYNAIVPLHWEESGDPTEYHVFRKEGTSDFTQIAVVETGFFSSASFIDENVTAGIEYTYIIKDQNDVDMTNQHSATCNNTGHSVTIPGWNTITPTVDGIMNAGEWDDAIEIDITNLARIYTTNTWTSNTYAYLKVANDKLFIAIKDYNSPTLEQNDQIMMFFDYNNDGLWTGADHDQRYLGVWLTGGTPDLYMERTEITGTYPNTSFGSGTMQPPEFTGWATEGTGYTSFEFAYDITGSYLEGHTDNFAMLLQSLIYEGGESQGLSALYSPGGIWRAPSTFFNCTVQYDADTEAPQVEAVEGTTAITGNDMPIILSISDQSDIQSVSGAYSIDGGTAQNLTMTASKGTFGYTGTIPAELTGVTGTINFYLEDVHGNNTTTTDYTIEWQTDDTPPVITPISTPTIATPTNIPVITAEITDDLAGIESVTLYYTVGGQTQQSLAMSFIDDVYTAQLPDQAIDAGVTYYIYANDNSDNNATSDVFTIVWYNGNWYGHIQGQNTGNNFGSIENFTMGLLLELGNFSGKINKLAYMIPEFFNPPFNWKVVEVNIDGSDVEWTENVLIPEQTVTEQLLYNASSWTEVDVESDVYLTGTVGLVIETQADSYWGRDANSTAGISWFIDSNTGEWAQLGVGYWASFQGDWTLKAHLYDENLAGVEKIVGNEGMRIYPNPAADYAIINFNLLTNQHVNIELLDINGKIIRKIASSNFSEGNYSLQINTSDLVGGIYFIKNTVGKTVSTKRFIVTK